MMTRDSEALGFRLGAWCAALILSVLVAGALMAGCADPAAADKAVAEWHTRTVAAMEAADVDPAAADEATWRKFGALVARDMLAETGGALPEGPAEPTDWWAFGANAASILLGYKGVTLGGQAIYSMFSGKASRGYNNLAALGSKDVSGMDTIKAIAAMLVETDTPVAAKPTGGAT
jgi:hypothetical protein